MTAIKEMALIKKHQAGPIKAYVTPATAGKRPQERETRPRDTTGRTGSGGSGGGGGTPTGDSGGSPTAPVTGGDDGGSSDPVKKTTDTVKETTDKVKDTVKETTDPVTEPVDEATGGTLTKAQATDKCIASGISALDVAALAACVDDLMN